MCTYRVLRPRFATERRARAGAVPTSREEAGRCSIWMKLVRRGTHVSMTRSRMVNWVALRDESEGEHGAERDEDWQESIAPRLFGTATLRKTCRSPAWSSNREPEFPLSTHRAAQTSGPKEPAARAAPSRVNTLTGFIGNVNLSAGLPSAVTASFNPSSTASTAHDAAARQHGGYGNGSR